MGERLMYQCTLRFSGCECSISKVIGDARAVLEQAELYLTAFLRYNHGTCVPISGAIARGAFVTL